MTDPIRIDERNYRVVIYFRQGRIAPFFVLSPLFVPPFDGVASLRIKSRS
jgi:hypothetical protein